jgi:hypothetical protein
MTSHPFQAPAEAVGARSIQLSSPLQVALAAFLGGPLAGCMLLAADYRDLGRSPAAPLGAGAGFLAVSIALGFVLPDWFPSVAIPASYTFGLRQWAIQLRNELPDGTEVKSRSVGFVAAVTIANLVGLLALVFAVVMVLPV